MGEHGKQGEHGEHWKDGKHQTHDLKHSIYDSKHSFCDSKHSFYFTAFMSTVQNIIINASNINIGLYLFVPSITSSGR